VDDPYGFKADGNNLANEPQDVLRIIFTIRIIGSDAALKGSSSTLAPTLAPSLDDFTVDERDDVTLAELDDVTVEERRPFQLGFSPWGRADEGDTGQLAA
jgi:hypothetical protein